MARETKTTKQKHHEPEFYFEQCNFSVGGGQTEILALAKAAEMNAIAISKIAEKINASSAAAIHIGHESKPDA